MRASAPHCFFGLLARDISRVFRCRFDLFAILRGARNRGDVLLGQLGRVSLGHHVLRLVGRAVPQHRPGDARHLVGKRRYCDVRM